MCRPLLVVMNSLFQGFLEARAVTWNLKGGFSDSFCCRSICGKAPRELHRLVALFTRKITPVVAEPEHSGECNDICDWLKLLEDQFNDGYIFIGGRLPVLFARKTPRPETDSRMTPSCSTYKQSPEKLHKFVETELKTPLMSMGPPGLERAYG